MFALLLIILSCLQISVRYIAVLRYKTLCCRDRHRELNEGINEVVRRVPGYQAFAKHSKVSSDGMVQPQIDRDRFRNVSNLDLVKLNRFTESGARYFIYARIRSLFANFLTLKMCMHLPFNDVRYLPDASSNVNYFLLL